jgi:ActR/RegA family two-component response regulator
MSLKKVLIIDDEESFYRSLYYTNPDRKEFTASEEEGLERSLDPTIHFVILDLSLHGKNNFQ